MYNPRAVHEEKEIYIYILSVLFEEKKKKRKRDLLVVCEIRFIFVRRIVRHAPGIIPQEYREREGERSLGCLKREKVRGKGDFPVYISQLRWLSFPSRPNIGTCNNVVVKITIE